MDHAVSHRGLVDTTCFWIGDGKRPVSLMLIGKILEPIMEPAQVVHKIPLEREHAPTMSLSSHEFRPRFE